MQPGTTQARGTFLSVRPLQRPRSHLTDSAWSFCVPVFPWIMTLTVLGSHVQREQICPRRYKEEGDTQ